VLCVDAVFGFNRSHDDGSGGIGDGNDDDCDIEPAAWALLTEWQRKGMKRKLITLAELWQELIQLWEKHKGACASLAVGSSEPRQPTVTGAHSQLQTAWSKRPAVNFHAETCPVLSTLRSWHDCWVKNGALLTPKAKGPQPGMTW
jgi:hypothetical protein